MVFSSFKYQRQEKSPGYERERFYPTNHGSVERHVPSQTESGSRSDRRGRTLLNKSRWAAAAGYRNIEQWKLRHWPRLSGTLLRIFHSSIRPLLTAAPRGPTTELQPARSSFTNWSWVTSEQRHFSTSRKREIWGGTTARGHISTSKQLGSTGLFFTPPACSARYVDF